MLILMGMLEHIVKHKRRAGACQRAPGGWGHAKLGGLWAGQAGPALGRGSAWPGRQGSRLGCWCIPCARDASLLLGLALKHCKIDLIRLFITLHLLTLRAMCNCMDNSVCMKVLTLSQQSDKLSDKL